MRPWFRLSEGVHERAGVRTGNDNHGEADSSESISLLPGSSFIPLEHPSYDSMSRSSDIVQSDGSTMKASNPPAVGQSRFEISSKKYTSSFTMVLSVVLLLSGMFVAVSFLPTSNPQSHTSSLSDMMLSELVVAPSVADETTTFQSLAQSMLPAWYNETLSQMPVFTPTVTPDQVYKTRKILLKTRDLLDVFSPVYPNKTDGIDLWKLTRHYLNWGYMIVGEFQDLHNAHILYSQEQMEVLREQVLEWKDAFEQFRANYTNVVKFLSSPSSGTFLHKESHLFWLNVKTLPSGTDSDTSALAILGTVQLHQVLEYLWSVFPYASVLDENAHEHYHNLRKELRSVVDEYELFGGIMFPDITPGVESSMTVLTSARKLLGDINDDWTAYTTYVENDEYDNEQQRLAREIDVAWAYFQLWVHESNFEGAIAYLLGILNPTQPEAFVLTIPSMNEFLEQRKKHPTNHFVIGNEAGDADSIISALTLAYIESTQEMIESTPIVSIPKADLSSQRPDVKLLLELAGIRNATNELIFVDDFLINHDANTASVSLVDHNAIEEKFQGKNWTVVEIVDHHCDQGYYETTCSGHARTIAFADGKALVASACTLVAERLSKVCNPLYPASVGLLLLGVILLDSVNLADDVGKVTQRDRDAVASLLENTDWQDLPMESQIILGMDSSSLVPNTEVVFDVLQNAKYDTVFWKSLSVIDALRYDYKEFVFESNLFGVSTVLMPLEDFFHKDHVAQGILRYMAQVNIHFLGIMFAFENEGQLCRQLALCGRNGFSLDDVDYFLRTSGYYRDPLDLNEIKNVSSLQDDRGLSLQFFDQRNVKPSRKQIGPILIEYFESSSSAQDQGLKDS